jgi:hypothetical protein
MHPLLRRWLRGPGQPKLPKRKHVQLETYAPDRYDVELDAETVACERLVVDYINALAPRGIDEATGHALDGFIDSLAEKWFAEVRMAHLDRQSTVDRMVSASRPLESRRDTVRAAHEFHLELLRGAVEAGRDRLTGDTRKIPTTP